MEQPIPPKLINRSYELFTALNWDVRKKIISLINAKGEVKMPELMVRLEMDTPAISHHLRVLSRHKIIVKRQEGRYFFYSLNYKTLHMIDKWMDRMWKELDEA